MRPADRVTQFLALAGFDRPAEKTIQTGKGKQVVLVPLEETERLAAYHAAAEKAIALHQATAEARDLTIASSRLAITRAIEAGEFLREMAQLFSSDFEEWLANYCSEYFGRATAYNYMKAVKYREALGDDCPDFATLTELYQACGVLPPPASSGSPKSNPPIFRLRFEAPKLSPDPAQWEPVIRRDFIAQAKPIAELLQKALEAEEGA